MDINVCLAQNASCQAPQSFQIVKAVVSLRPWILSSKRKCVITVTSGRDRKQHLDQGFLTLNLGSTNAFYGVCKPKSNQENPLVFIRPFVPLFSLIAPHLQPDMFMLQVDWPFLFVFVDINWRQVETWNLLPVGTVEVLTVRSNKI